MVTDEDQLRTVWSDPDSRDHFLEQLSDRGYDPDRLGDIRQLVDAPKSDLFDVLSYVLFANPPKTRKDRADGLQQSDLLGFEGELKTLLMTVLKAYVESGEAELGTRKLKHYLEARYGSVRESKAKLGDLASIKDAYKRMQAGLYAS